MCEGQEADSEAHVAKARPLDGGRSGIQLLGGEVSPPCHRGLVALGIKLKLARFAPLPGFVEDDGDLQLQPQAMEGGEAADDVQAIALLIAPGDLFPRGVGGPSVLEGDKVDAAVEEKLEIASEHRRNRGSTCRLNGSRRRDARGKEYCQGLSFHGASFRWRRSYSFILS